jgi:hypothetical protein
VQQASSRIRLQIWNFGSSFDRPSCLAAGFWFEAVVNVAIVSQDLINGWTEQFKKNRHLGKSKLPRESYHFIRTDIPQSGPC